MNLKSRRNRIAINPRSDPRTTDATSCGISKSTQTAYLKPPKHISPSLTKIIRILIDIAVTGNNNIDVKFKKYSDIWIEVNIRSGVQTTFLPVIIGTVGAITL